MLKRLLYLFCLIALLGACSLDNTMYNARAYFKSAKDRPLNANGRPSPQAVADYTKAIEKCGIILTERKDSPDTDDALFLMARALFYKGNSAFQAKEQFDNLIRVFPSSPFVPEAYIYIARINREINRPREAETLLEEFVRNQEYRKHHPRALLVLSEFEIVDKDYHRAQYWLEKLLTEYPKTPEYNEAFFLFGKNYFVQAEYNKSLDEFEKLTRTRGVAKELKLEASYYIGLNLYYLGQFEKGYRILRSLINSEYRNDRIALARVLKARFQLAMGDREDAIKEFDYVNKTYPRTAASAEAFYYMAEDMFYQRAMLAEAINSYNRVRSEFVSSDLSAISQAKSKAITQLNQANNLNSETNLQQFLDYHYLAADNYLKPLALPDSTLLMYQRILQEQDRFVATRDSLLVKKQSLASSLDSLRIQLDSIEISDTSTVAVSDTLILEIEPEELEPEPTIEDTESEELEPEPTIEDTELIDAEPAVADSTSRVSTPQEQINRINSKISELQIQDTGIQSRLDTIEGHLERYSSEVVPFTYFVKASFYKRQLDSSASVDSILAYLSEEYPESKYTNAVRQLSLGQPIRLVDRKQELAEQKLDFALGLVKTEPDSMRILLQELIASDYDDLALKANFRLGWHYTFEVPDTTAAKPYLDEVLKSSNSGDYGVLVRRFYGGTKFLFAEIAAELDSLASVIDSLMVVIEPEESLPGDVDETLEEAVDDTLEEASDEINDAPSDIEKTEPPDEVPIPSEEAQDPTPDTVEEDIPSP
jgi:TolA-binding protein